MTSRELTGMFSLPDARVGLDRSGQLSELAWRVGFGAIGWPWLLRSLWGGRLRDKQALLDELGLPHDALPHLGSWKADVSFLRRIVQEIDSGKPRQVVELGAGASTLIAARALRRSGGGQLLSVDQHADFVAATCQWLADHDLSADIRTAPLERHVPSWPGRWYAIDDLPDRIDLLIVDGPPWAVHPLVRGAAECLFARLAPGGVILLDDAARPGERIVARRWRRRWPSIDFCLDTRGAKGRLIGRKRG